MKMTTHSEAAAHVNIMVDVVVVGELGTGMSSLSDAG
jgi:hypothetical protein